MKTIASDTELRTQVRSIAAHYRLDLQRLTLRITRGTVRVGGELLWLGRSEERLPLTIVESLERDLVRMRGASHLYFDLKNWRRLGTGEWVPQEHSERPREAGPAMRSSSSGDEAESEIG